MTAPLWPDLSPIPPIPPLTQSSAAPPTDWPRQPPLHLAELTDADRSVWEPLARGYKAFYNTEVDAAGYDAAWRRLRAGPPLLALGAWRQDRLLGMAHGVFHASPWADEVCYLQDLFTSPDARGLGVAAALIKELARHARRRGCARLYWLTHESNARARALYDRVAQHHGFIRYDLATPL